jgi:glycosyltransferase involved in cell wall biosynthesis
VRVAIDATPLVGKRTGVAAVVSGLVGALRNQPDIDLVGYGLTIRGWRAVRSALPPGVSHAWLPMPAQPLLRLWRHIELPPVEGWTGPVDVVHGTNFVVPPSRHAGRLVTVHDLSPLLHPELCTPTSRQYPALLRRAIRTGASVHAVSQTVAEEILESFRISQDRVHVVPNGLTVPEVPPDLPDAAQPYLLALGTAEPRKNFPQLVQAFGSVAAKFPDLHLKIAGPSGWGEQALKSAIEASPHKERIQRVGWIEDTATLIKQATLFVFPSLYEGFGIPPLEAMSLGVPVVASAAGALPEVLDDAALLVSPGDVSALAEGIMEALENSTLREDLIQRGLARARSFDWATSGQEMVAVYKRLVDSVR